LSSKESRPCAVAGWVLVVPLLWAQAGTAAEEPARRTAREALRPFNVLIGSWNALGVPEGSAEQKRTGSWQEAISWEWQFKDKDAWLKVSFTKGKRFAEGTLRYLADTDQYQLALTTGDRETLTFTGPLKDHRLVLERRDEPSKEVQRIVLSLVGDNRYLYHYEVRPEDRTLFRKVYLVGATKVGQPLVAVSDEIGPLCVVSYGPPLMPMSYKGKTYYVCCNSCRQEFRTDPEKYIKEYEEMLAQMARDRAEKNKKP
jgi:hypothetical protein